MKISFANSMVLLAIASLLGFGCKKQDTKTVAEDPIDPYVYSADLQSSKDVSFLNYTVSDIEMICSFLGEGVFNNIFYSAQAGSTVTIVRDTNAKMCSMSFNNSLCLDGKTRSGTIFFSYGPLPGAPGPGPGPAPRYLRDYKYEGRVTFSDYYVGPWKVVSAQPLLITNTLPSPNFDPANTKLTWTIAGQLKLVKGNDSLTWNGSITKTLENTNDPAVFPVSKKSPINWPLAKISYTGKVTGNTPGNVPFSLTIAEPVVRDFTCAPPENNKNGVTQFHPYVSGVATFTSSNYHPRTINFGPSGACDSKGKISFKDESHEVDFGN